MVFLVIYHAEAADHVALPKQLIKSAVEEGEDQIKYMRPSTELGCVWGV